MHAVLLVCILVRWVPPASVVIVMDYVVWCACACVCEEVYHCMCDVRTLYLYATFRGVG